MASDANFSFIHRGNEQNALIWRWENLPLPWDDVEASDASFSGNDAANTPKWSDLAMEKFLNSTGEASGDSTLLKPPKITQDQQRLHNLPR